MPALLLRTAVASTPDCASDAPIMSPRKDPTHYYEDGNVLLFAGNVQFRVHASILRRSSDFFEKLLNGNWRETNPQDNPSQASSNSSGGLSDHGSDDAPIVARVKLPGKDPKHVESLLSTLYLHTKHRVSWANVQPILHLADEYLFPRVLARCDQFLRRELKKKPLEVLVLADRYRLPAVRKEACLLVLDDYSRLCHRPEYKELTMDTRVELQAAIAQRGRRGRAISVRRYERNGGCTFCGHGHYALPA
ncbi:hypothetical protein BC938DRAFT_477345 [Jimgerdemannia flammicorona]|uniref:BTB domain-containing protein n=1 Tax=Jimgerdemannia flammicorona TaxID=994334 RepID=A0A433PAE5_9FUNG|nr:hypothetical protein BC938DRAFT_477345 [Jimgerdemannia flammicorona]